jgi:hypothetical protein
VMLVQLINADPGPAGIGESNMKRRIQTASRKGH